MSTVASIFNHKIDPRSFKSSEDLLDPYVKIGVEIELENFMISNTFPLRNNPFWNIYHDESLRGQSAELRFNFPLNGKDFMDSLTGLHASILSLEELPSVSDRTSTHIHLDAQHLSAEQLYNWIILYILFERTLYRYVGNKRAKSIFCVPFFKANKDLSIINRILSTKPLDIYDYLYDYFNDGQRYGGLNLNSLFKFGSMEFRMLDAEWKKDRLLLWVNILMSIRNLAVNMNIPIKKYIDSLGGKLPEKILEEVFGELHETLHTKHLRMDLVQGMRLANEIINENTILELPWEVIRIAKQVNMKGDYLNKFKHRNPELFKEKEVKKKKKLYDLDMNHTAIEHYMNIVNSPEES